MSFKKSVFFVVSLLMVAVIKASSQPTVDNALVHPKISISGESGMHYVKDFPTRVEIYDNNAEQLGSVLLFSYKFDGPVLKSHSYYDEDSPDDIVLYEYVLEDNNLDVIRKWHGLDREKYNTDRDTYYFEDGFLKQWVSSYNEKNQPEITYELQYEQRVLAGVSSFASRTGSSRNELTYFYEEGDLVRLEYHNSDFNIIKENSEVLIKEEVGEGQDPEIIRQKFDENGRLIFEYHYYPRGEYQHEEVYFTYDAEGRIETARHYYYEMRKGVLGFNMNYTERYYYGDLGVPRDEIITSETIGQWLDEQHRQKQEAERQDRLEEEQEAIRQSKVRRVVLVSISMVVIIALVIGIVLYRKKKPAKAG